MINNNTTRDILNSYHAHFNSPHNEKNNNILDISPSQSMNNNKENILIDNNNFYMTEEKSKELALLLNKKNINQIKLDNNFDNYGYNNIKKIKPVINKESLSIIKPNILSNTKNNVMRNRSYYNLNNNNTTTNNSMFSNNNNSLFNDTNINLAYNMENMNSKFSNKKQMTKEKNIDYHKTINFVIFFFKIRNIFFG